MSYDFITQSCFVVVGLTRAGKSSFINALSDSDSCVVAKDKNKCTLTNQLVTFLYNNHRFNAIDTPGLDSSENNDEQVNSLKKVLVDHPNIKAIIIVKHYNDLRTSALSSFIEAFPCRTFWDHVIIVNTWANPHDESFIDYMEEKNETYLDRVLKCEKLLYIMQQKKINMPTKLKEYYVCSKKIKRYPEVAQEFNQIKNDIRNMAIMFKAVKVSDILERSKENEHTKGFYIVTKYRTITCIDFDDQKNIVEYIIDEKAVIPSECKIVKVEEELEFYEDDDLQWYDFVSLGIARAVRNTKKYKVYKVYYYQVADKLVKGQRVFDRIEYM